MPADLPELAPDCERCAGLCCVVLPFARSADFPVDKPAGVACGHLDGRDRCRVHDRLRAEGWRGCATYDCFGAGQQVTRLVLGGRSWRDDPALLRAAQDALPLVHGLHEVLALLREARGLAVPAELADLDRLLDEVVAAAAEAPGRVVGGEPSRVDLAGVRSRAAPLLRAVSRRVRTDARRGLPRLGRQVRAGADLAGRDLRGHDLVGADLRGALLIAADLRGADLRRADLLGADLRDADLRGARLEGALFLTRPQLSAALTG